MKSFLALIVLTLGLLFAVTSASAQMMDNKSGNPMVGGAAMYKTKNIVENAVNSKDHTTLVAAVQAAFGRHAKGCRAVHRFCTGKQCF